MSANAWKMLRIQEGSHTCQQMMVYSRAPFCTCVLGTPISCPMRGMLIDSREHPCQPALARYIAQSRTATGVNRGVLVYIQQGAILYMFPGNTYITPQERDAD